MKRAVTTFAAMAAALLVGGVVLIEGTLESENQTSRYETRSAAEADGLFSRGWLPEFIPGSSRRIVEVHNLDSNEVCARFEVEPDAAVSLMQTLPDHGFDLLSAPPPPPRRFSRSHPCPFAPEQLRSIEAAYQEGAPAIGRAAYFAIANDRRTVYYWSRPADRNHSKGYSTVRVPRVRLLPNKPLERTRRRLFHHGRRRACGAPLNGRSLGG